MSGLVPEGIHLNTDGVVEFNCGDLHGFMHPFSFRDLYGEDAYQELLARPRVLSPYVEGVGE
jgi:hypothetical protein